MPRNSKFIRPSSGGLETGIRDSATRTQHRAFLAFACAVALIALSAGALASATRPGQPLADEDWVSAAVKAARQNYPGSDVVIFVVDSPPDDWFVDGLPPPVLQQNYEPSHGSLVSRVIREYCSSPIVPIPVVSEGKGVNHAHYIVELFTVLRYVEAHPKDRVLVNISLGSPQRDPVEEAIVARLVKAGALIIAAAGNDGVETPMYPAACEGVVAVACATRQGKVASSNYGSHVAAAATGDITFIDYDFLPQSVLRREMHASGTSFAAPELAAMVAFAMEHNAGMSPRAAFEKVRSTLVPLDDELFRAGKLGGGYLSIPRTKATISPFYGVRHYVLPIFLLVVGAAVTIYVVARWKWRGALGAAGGWFAGIILCMLVVIGWRQAARFAPHVTLANPWVYVLEFVGLAAAILIRRGKVGGSVALWIVVMLASLVLKATGVESVHRAVFVVAACTGWAMLLELPMLLLIRRVRTAPQCMSQHRAASYLYDQYNSNPDEPRVRRAAHRALNELPAEVSDEFLFRVTGPDGVAVTSVRGIRKSEQEKLDRERAVTETASKVRAATEVQSVIEALAHQDARVRRAACEAARNVKDARAVEPLIAALKDADVRVRLAAARALGALNDPRAVEPLIAALKDGDDNVRLAAAGALGGLGDARALVPLIAALKDESQSVCKAAAEAIEGMPPVVEPLAAALGDESSFVRECAARALGRSDDPRAVEALSAALWQDRDTRWIVAEALTCTSGGLNLLLVALEDKDASVRAAAARALGTSSDSRAVEPLVAALRDGDERVRAAADEALRKLDASGAVQSLILDGQPVPLTPGTDDGDVVVRMDMESLAAQIDGDPAFRQAMADALARTSQIIENIMAELRNENAEVRQAAAQALTAITGQNFGEDCDAWQKWWEENKGLYAKPEGRSPNDESMAKPE